MGREMKGYPVGLVGESNYQANIRQCKVGDPVFLYREPGNPHDPHAIVVTDRFNRRLGYISRENFVQRVVHEDGCGISAEIFGLRVNDGSAGVIEVVIDAVVIDDPLGEMAFHPDVLPTKPKGGWFDRTMSFLGLR